MVDVFLLIPAVVLVVTVVLYFIIKLKKAKTETKKELGDQTYSAHDLVNAWSTTASPESVHQMPTLDRVITEDNEFDDTTRLKKALFGAIVYTIFETLPKSFLRRYNTRVEVGFTKVVPVKGEIRVIDPKFIGEDFIIFSVFGGFISTAIALAVATWLEWSYLMLIGAGLIAPILGFASIFLIPYFQFEKRRDKVESHLPDVLEQLSTMSGLKNMDEIVGYLAETRLGAVSEEFAIANHILKRNLNLDLALRRMRARTESKSLDRVLKLLTEGAMRGVDVGDAAKKMAESLRNKHMIVEERSASLSLQRYTLLAAAAVLVPIILGVVWGISNSLASLSEMSMGGGVKFNPQKTQEILDVVRSTFGLYVVIHAVEASFSVARQEGDIKKSIFYIVPLAAISYFVFNNIASVASSFLG